MVDAEIVELRVPPKKIATLFINHQLLNQLVLFKDVQMKSSWRFASPKINYLMNSFVSDMQTSLTNLESRSYSSFCNAGKLE